MNDRPMVIRATGLAKSYGSIRAVDDVDLEIRRGVVFALLGPNGAGKTTAVEMLEGYRRPDRGRIRVLGVDPARADARWRSRIGIVTQQASDAGELTVGEIVEHFAAYYPDPRDPAEVIDLVGLTELRRRRVMRLSGGQRRRIDVALGIIGGPELLFLDEPTTGFDPKARRTFWDLIRALAGAGTTILLTTHYLDEAEALADRVAVIAAGRIVALDSPARLGGRADATATVGWTDPTSADHFRHERSTATPTALVAELAAEFGGEVPGLTVRRPTLEDTYLRLIGQSEGEAA